VTHVGIANENATTARNDDDAFEWPQDHSLFLDSQQAQSQVLLNIAAAPPCCPPFQQVRGNTHMVAPGSLRQHGDYCLIDVGVHADGDTSKEGTNGKQTRCTTYSWRVDCVQFCNMNSVSA